MKKYLLAAALIVSFAAPAFAEEFYVAFDPASSQMHDDAQPASRAHEEAWATLNQRPKPRQAYGIR